MKSIILIAVLIFGAINSKYLKTSQDNVVQKSVNPKDVKSLGEFSNISPDATKVITPKYASKFNTIKTTTLNIILIFLFKLYF